MAMDTQAASAITRGARRLKDAAVDAVVIPSPKELMARKSAELRAAQDKLDAIVKKQIALEVQPQSQRRGYDALVAEKARTIELIARLQNESGILKAAWRKANPLPEMTPAQARVAAAAFRDPWAGVKRGSPEQIAAAQAEVDALVMEYRLNRPAGNAGDAWTVKSNAARLRLTALQGPPYPPNMPWATRESLKAERKLLGLE